MTRTTPSDKDSVMYTAAAITILALIALEKIQTAYLTATETQQK